MEIDVQGAQAVRREFPDALAIFVRPASINELERRLRQRGTESETAVARRLEVARRELTHAETYDHQVVNDELARAAAEICEILTAAGEIPI